MSERTRIVLGIGLVVALVLSDAAFGFEFRAASMGGLRSTATVLERMGSLAEYGRRWRGSPARSGQEVEFDVKPEECRFYLAYRDEGKQHSKLLDEARKIEKDLQERISNLDKSRIKIEMISYNPHVYVSSLFRRQKAEILLQFRITVKLKVGEKRNQWDDAKLVAQVMDMIAELKKDNKLGRKLSEGTVRYAVKSIEPTRKQLLAKAEKQIKALRVSHARANGIAESELYCDISYDGIQTKTQSLEKVVVFLPYTVSFELKEAMKK